MKYLLIYHEVGLGHIIIFNSLLNNLLKNGYQIEIICVKKYKEYFNLFYPKIKFHSFLSDTIKMLLRIKNMENYDKIFFLTNNKNTEKSMKIFIPKKYHNKTLFNPKKFKKGYYLTIKEANSYINELNPIENIFLNTQNIQKKPVEIIFDNYIAISPFSSQEKKDYPINKMIKIIDYLVDKYKINIVIPSPKLNFVSKNLIKFRTKNHSRYDEFKKMSKFPKNIQIFKCDLVDLIKVIHFSDFSISMDSGPWHLGNSLKQKCIAIFPKRNKRWYYEKSDIIYDNMVKQKIIPPESCNCQNIKDIPVNKIIDEIEKLNLKHKMF